MIGKIVHLDGKDWVVDNIDHHTNKAMLTAKNVTSFKSVDIDRLK